MSDKSFCVFFTVTEILFVYISSDEEWIENLVTKYHGILFIANIIIIFIIKQF